MLSCAFTCTRLRKIYQRFAAADSFHLTKNQHYNLIGIFKLGFLELYQWAAQMLQYPQVTTRPYFLDRCLLLLAAGTNFKYCI